MSRFLCLNFVFLVIFVTIKVKLIMLTAYSESLGKKVEAARIQNKQDSFFCECCGLPLQLRKGVVRIPHFAHLPEATCHYKGESQLHLRIKKSIYITLQQEIGNGVKSIELEKYLKENRPDVYVEGFKKTIAIEIQVSHLSPTEILRRTALYYQKGIYVLWILPFEMERILEYDEVDQIPQFKAFRLKEYERIMMYLYFKNLVFWDISQQFSESFIVLQLDDAWTEENSYYSLDWSTLLTFDPKKMKNKKQPVRIQYNVGLQDFLPSFGRKFKMPKANYYLPDRYILNYKWPK